MLPTSRRANLEEKLLSLADPRYSLFAARNKGVQETGIGRPDSTILPELHIVTANP